VSHPHILSGGDTRSSLVATLGADFHHAVAPVKAELLELARVLGGDVHRAAMRLLIEREGRRPSAMEQQLILAALAELQGADAPGADPLARATERFEPAAASGHRRQGHALQVH
jgi:hypothetical protein